MTTDTGSLFLIHPHRSKEAFFDLLEDWQGILVSDGYGGYQTWGNHRQPCLAPLMRTARGLAAKPHPELACLWQVDAQGSAALVPEGESPAYGGPVAGGVGEILLR
jgi:transposase